MLSVKTNVRHVRKIFIYRVVYTDCFFYFLARQ